MSLIITIIINNMWVYLSQSRGILHEPMIKVILKKHFNFPTPAPPLLLAPQLRTTRSPLLSSRLTHTPELAETSETLGCYDGKTRLPRLPLASLQMQTPNSGRRIKRKRKRSKPVRTQAVFWRPDPFLGGKSAGYAFGYRS
jgi:hypothetical protein